MIFLCEKVSKINFHDGPPWKGKKIYLKTMKNDPQQAKTIIFTAFSRFFNDTFGKASKAMKGKEKQGKAMQSKRSKAKKSNGKARKSQGKRWKNMEKQG